MSAPCPASAAPPANGGSFLSVDYAGSLHQHDQTSFDSPSDEQGYYSPENVLDAGLGVAANFLFSPPGDKAKNIKEHNATGHEPHRTSSSTPSSSSCPPLHDLFGRQYYEFGEENSSAAICLSFTLAILAYYFGFYVRSKSTFLQMKEVRGAFTNVVFLWGHNAVIETVVYIDGQGKDSPGKFAWWLEFLRYLCFMTAGGFWMVTCLSIYFDLPDDPVRLKRLLAWLDKRCFHPKNSIFFTAAERAQKQEQEKIKMSAGKDGGCGPTTGEVLDEDAVDKDETVPEEEYGVIGTGGFGRSFVEKRLGEELLLLAKKANYYDLPPDKEAVRTRASALEAAAKERKTITGTSSRREPDADQQHEPEHGPNKTARKANTNRLKVKKSSPNHPPRESASETHFLMEGSHQRAEEGISISGGSASAMSSFNGFGEGSSSDREFDSRNYPSDFRGSAAQRNRVAASGHDGGRGLTSGQEGGADEVGGEQQVHDWNHPEDEYLPLLADADELPLELKDQNQLQLEGELQEELKLHHFQLFREHVCHWTQIVYFVFTVLLALETVAVGWGDQWLPGVMILTPVILSLVVLSLYLKREHLFRIVDLEDLLRPEDGGEDRGDSKTKNFYGSEEEGSSVLEPTSRADGAIVLEGRGSSVLGEVDPVTGEAYLSEEDYRTAMRDEEDSEGGRSCDSALLEGAGAAQAQDPEPESMEDETMEILRLEAHYRALTKDLSLTESEANKSKLAKRRKKVAKLLQSRMHGSAGKKVTEKRSKLGSKARKLKQNVLDNHYSTRTNFILYAVGCVCFIVAYLVDRFLREPCGAAFCHNMAGCPISFLIPNFNHKAMKALLVQVGMVFACVGMSGLAAHIEADSFGRSLSLPGDAFPGREEWTRGGGGGGASGAGGGGGFGSKDSADMESPHGGRGPEAGQESDSDGE